MGGGCLWDVVAHGLSTAFTNEETANRVSFVWPWKMVLLSVCYLFYQPMDEKTKTWTLRFPAKENPNMEKNIVWLANRVAVWRQSEVSIILIFRKFLGHEVFSSEHLLNQPKATRVCIHSTKQSNHSISLCLLFLFSSRVFISRSYENRSISNECGTKQNSLHLFHSSLTP